MRGETTGQENGNESLSGADNAVTVPQSEMGRIHRSPYRLRQIVVWRAGGQWENQRMGRRVVLLDKAGDDARFCFPEMFIHG